MDYEKRIEEKLKRINGLLGEQEIEIKGLDMELMQAIRGLDNGPNKVMANDMRNRLMQCMKTGNRDEVNKIINELKSKGVNLSNAG